MQNTVIFFYYAAVMIIELILYENEWINNRSGRQTEDCLGGTNPEKKIGRSSLQLL
jgi:hypothetical protein